MKGNVLHRAVVLLACLGLLTLLVPSAIAGPPSGGRSHGANAWGGGRGSYAAPAYYGGSAQGVYAAPVSATAAPANVNRAFYYDPDTDATADGAAAVINVEVPANAEVWFNDYKTKLTGPARRFVSPPLQAGQPYSYRLRVRWLENGLAIEQTRQVAVASGAQTTVVFVPVQNNTSGSASASR